MRSRIASRDQQPMILKLRTLDCQCYCYMPCKDKTYRNCQIIEAGVSCMLTALAASAS